MQGQEEFGTAFGEPVLPRPQRPLSEISLRELEEAARGFGSSRIPGYTRQELFQEYLRRQSQSPAPTPATPPGPEAPAATPAQTREPPFQEQSASRPSAPAAALPPRVGAGTGNIEELLQRRLGQIQAPQTAQSFMDNPWMALLQGSLSMMDSRGKSLAEALAGGGRSALGVLEQQRGRKESAEQQRYAREMERARLENEIRKAEYEREIGAGRTAVTQRGHDIEYQVAQMRMHHDANLQNLRTEAERRQYTREQARALEADIRQLQTQRDNPTITTTQEQRNVIQSQINGIMQERRRLLSLGGEQGPTAVPTTDQGRLAR